MNSKEKLNDFQQVYEQIVVKEMKKLEKKRKWLIKKIRLDLVLLLVVSPTAFIVLSFHSSYLNWVVLIIATLYWCVEEVNIIEWLIKHVKKGLRKVIEEINMFSNKSLPPKYYEWLLVDYSEEDYKQEFKNKVINKMIVEINENLNYYPNREMPIKLVKEFIPDEYTDYNVEDYVKGRINKTDIKFSETRFIVNKDYGEKIIFNGLFFVADFNKQFKSRVLVKPDILESKLGYFGRRLQKFIADFDVEEQIVDLENVEFEEEFKIIATDEQEARYLLTPKFMERVLALQKKLERKTEVYDLTTDYGFDKRMKLKGMAFADSKLHILISIGDKSSSNKNLFEPNIQCKYGCTRKEIKYYYKVLNLLMGIVEDLDLNNYIY